MSPSLADDIAKGLIEAGVEDALVRRAVQLTVKAIEAGDDLLEVCAKIRGRGYTDEASEIWSLYLSGLISVFPPEKREKYLEIVLKLAEAMDENGLESPLKN